MLVKKQHDFCLGEGIYPQDIFVFADDFFRLDFGHVDNIKFPSEIIISEYLLQTSYTDNEVVEKILLLQKTPYCLDFFIKILSSIQILSILGKGGFSNLFLVNDRLGVSKLVSIKIESIWKIGNDGFIKISNYYFKVSVPDHTGIWHAGNKICVVGSK